MASSLYDWPAGGRVDRVISKERLYAEAGVTTRLKQEFIEVVQRIRWAYKIGEESVRLKAVASVQEFQVFEVELKGSEAPDAVLKAIDKAIPSPVVFELTRLNGEVQVAAARKEPGLRGPKLSSHFRSAWLQSDSPRADLPPALDLRGLYETILASLLPVSRRPDEALSEVIDRLAQVSRLEREIGALSRRLRTEPQVNRKVEIRRSLRAKEAQLATLKQR